VFVYLIRRLLLMIPTFFGITILSFFIINLAPGGPIEQKIQAMRFGSSMAAEGSAAGAKAKESGVNEEVIEALKKQYGFDKPIHERYFIWLTNIVKLDFGESFTYEEPAIDVISSKFPVSLQFGLTSLFLVYIVCIPLGVAKAVKAGTPFDRVTSIVLFIMYAIPALILGIYLITFFAGGSYFDWFPIGGAQGDDYDGLSFWGKVLDRTHHFILPLICYMIGSFTSLTTLQRNTMLDVIKSDYVRTARAKGLAEKIVYYKHALRNALIPIATGIGGFFGVFLSGSLLIENVFNLDGIGRLSYQSILSRDYNVIMAMIFLSSMVLLIGRLFSDIIYVIIDPRIDYK
jgi:microcin C transport system permease protein